MSKSIIVRATPKDQKAAVQRCTCLSQGRLHRSRGTTRHSQNRGEQTVVSMSKVGTGKRRRKGEKMVIREKNSFFFFLMLSRDGLILHVDVTEF